MVWTVNVKGERVEMNLKTPIAAVSCALAMKLLMPSVHDTLESALAALFSSRAPAPEIIETMGASLACDGLCDALETAFSQTEESISCLSEQ